MSEPLSIDIQYRAGSLALRAAFTVHVQRAALFGPSGAGKTTLLRIVAGLVRPDRGTIALNGRVLLDTVQGVDVAAGRREIGFLTQTPALFPHLKVEDNVRFGMEGLDLQEKQGRTEELLRLFALEEMRARLPRHLSGGERQRVALARALAPEIRLLLLDEPFGALDGARKSQLWAMLDPYLRERGIATLLVSHDAGEVWAGAQSVIRMEAGVATEQGSPAEMLHSEREQVLRQLGAV